LLQLKAAVGLEWYPFIQWSRNMDLRGRTLLPAVIRPNNTNWFGA